MGARALRKRRPGSKKAGAATGALAGGETTNEEGWLLQRLVRDALGSPHVDSRAAGALDPEQARVLARPDLSARVSDIDYASALIVTETELMDESPSSTFACARRYADTVCRS